jgi:hypothetical protein
LVLTAGILCVFGIFEVGFIYSGAIKVIVFLEMYALVISSLMLLFNSKYVWYGSVVFWILVIMTCLVYSIWLGFDSLVLFWAVVFMICSLWCLMVFNSREIKSYFGV